MSMSLTPQTFAGGEPWPSDFYQRDPRHVAPDLLGAIVVSVAHGCLVAGRIVETEAYLGSDDAGSHAATKGITARNAVMYGPPGTAYVYFTYGNHHMLNIVCERDGVAGAVLIRALEPVEGLDVMAERRGERPLVELCNGPGKLAKALGLSLADNGVRLGEGSLQVYAGPRRVTTDQVAVTGRIGLREGHELPYRYHIAGSPFVSKGRTGPLRQPATRTGRAARKEST